MSRETQNSCHLLRHLIVLRPYRDIIFLCSVSVLSTLSDDRSYCGYFRNDRRSP